MLKAGDFFLSGNTGSAVATFVPWGKAYAGVAPAHIFHYAKMESLRIGSQQTKVARFGSGFDLAIFPVFAACKPTELGKLKLGTPSWWTPGPEIRHVKRTTCHHAQAGQKVSEKEYRVKSMVFRALSS